MTHFHVVRTLTVRRDYSAGPEAGAVIVNRNCGLGCTCAATIYKTAGPTPRLAEGKTLCFNDRTLEGISEIAGSARLVPAGPGVTAYEVQANASPSRAAPIRRISLTRRQKKRRRAHRYL